MIRFVFACFAAPSIALAGLPSDPTEPPHERLALEKISVPCLRKEGERRYVVTWWIEDKLTGERRAVGSQEVRLRC